MTKPRKYLLRFACIVAAEIISTGATRGDAQTLPDERILRVDAFFESYGCPSPNHASAYVRAADQYGVDYRVLPVISLLESTCGSFHRGNNNHWGWNSGRTGFASVPNGIDFITRQLAQGRAYRERDLEGKLFAYNPRTAYVEAVRRLMQEIETDQP